jgi:hypothetical protein
MLFPSSSWPGKSAKRVFAQMSRPSTPFVLERREVDARDFYANARKTRFALLRGHDERMV